MYSKKLRDLVRSWLGALVLVTVAMSSAYAADADQVIEYRKQIMSMVGGNLKASAQIMRGKLAEPGSLAAQARILALAAGLAETAFKENTDGKGSSKTTARGNIWTDWQDFSARLGELRMKTEVFADAAQAGDMAAAGDALKQVGGTCKGCHRNYRVKK